MTPDAVLTVDLGQHSHPWAPEYGRWVRQPTADFRCPRCGATDSAAGDAAVRAFVATIQRTHAAVCTAEPTTTRPPSATGPRTTTREDT